MAATAVSDLTGRRNSLLGVGVYRSSKKERYPMPPKPTYLEHHHFLSLTQNNPYQESYFWASFLTELLNRHSLFAITDPLAPSSGSFLRFKALLTLPLSRQRSGSLYTLRPYSCTTKDLLSGTFPQYSGTQLQTLSIVDEFRLIISYLYALHLPLNEEKDILALIRTFSQFFFVVLHDKKEQQALFLKELLEYAPFSPYRKQDLNELPLPALYASLSREESTPLLPSLEQALYKDLLHQSYITAHFRNAKVTFPDTTSPCLVTGFKKDLAKRDPLLPYSPEGFCLREYLK